MKISPETERILVFRVSGYQTWEETILARERHAGEGETNRENGPLGTIIKEGRLMPSVLNPINITPTIVRQPIPVLSHSD